MAERRMFSKTIVQSSRFLKMPVSSRELYFQMGMMADDDGVVEAWNVMKLTNAREDDLRVLVSKGYVQILDNEDMIAYLTDWETNNTIRKDRYHSGIYKDLKVQILEGLDADNQLTTKWQPSDNQVATEISIGKGSIGKDSIEESKDTHTEKHKYGEYRHVLLTDREMELLQNDYEQEIISGAIKILDEYIEMKGTKYKSHYLALKKWALNEAQKGNKGTAKPQSVFDQWMNA